MSKQYTADEKRDIALGAAQHYLRMMEIEPSTRDGWAAYHALGDLARVYPDRVAAEFYQKHSKHQLNLFIRDWNKWAAKEQEELKFQAWAKERGWT